MGRRTSCFREEIAIDIYPIGGLPLFINIGMVIGQELQGLCGKPVETIHCIETALRQMIGLPDEY